jgi:hypothetical protein
MCDCHCSTLGLRTMPSTQKMLRKYLLNKLMGKWVGIAL